MEARSARSNPIPDTLELVPNYGTLSIFRIPASRYWYARAYLSRKVIKRSLKTENKSDAFTKAKKFYNSLLVKVEQNQPLTTGSDFEKVTAGLLREDKEKSERGELAPSTYRNELYLFTNDIIPFFRKVALRDINYTKLIEYVAHLKVRGRKPIGSKTIKHQALQAVVWVN